jgi:hypothetical protein
MAVMLFDDGRQKQILALLMIGAHFPLSALMKVKPSTLRPGGEGEMAPNRPQTLIRLDGSVGSNSEVPGFARHVRYPQEQTSSACPGMSVWCQQATFEWCIKKEAAN